MTPRLKRFLISVFLSLFVALFFGVAFWLGIFGTWQAKLNDKLFLKRQPSGEILLAAIDDKSLAAIGQWPWPRAVHAQFLNNLALAAPKAVGYDVIFSEPSKFGAPDDQSFSNALRRLKVVLPLEGQPLEIKKNQPAAAANLIEPLKVFLDNAAKQAHVNVLSDDDGLVRRLPVFINFSGRQIPALSLSLSELAGGPKASEVIAGAGQSLRINYVGLPGSFKTVSFVDIFSGQTPAEALKDKIVLVGATSADLHDAQMTPFSLGRAMAGIEIHANALDTILNRRYLREIGAAGVWPVIFALCLFNALSFYFFKKIWVALAAGLFFWLIYLGAALLFFERGIIFNLTHPTLAFFASLMVVLVFNYLAESREKDYLRKSFQFYLEPGVIEQIIQDPAKLKLGGQKKEMTVLFSDIRGFTSLSEKTDPEIMVSLLNEYFTAMTEIILKSGGVLDKFIGDAIMAFWGAPREIPDHAFLACDAALKMIERLTVLKGDWLRRGLPDLNIGIGINSGQMLVGNMGSSTRFNYTVIGDNVNLAARLEGLNKEYGTNIIVSRFTRDKVADKFNCPYLDKVNVKGKEIPVEIYRLSGRKN
ncbi:MAG: adenylate/guanylate cyclase domain-containing protein [Candidatus Portnoybacteria bacterium]|nr:adenylate/guanylate cyclase domain-containing protein [Candidatus Portnoybacteria bacterium]MDD4982526.1 adenylate/guanylate cyclase domain-containing protein [Candidatus Portnoybacteria bacterium]